MRRMVRWGVSGAIRTYSVVDRCRRITVCPALMVLLPVRVGAAAPRPETLGTTVELVVVLSLITYHCRPTVRESE